MPVHNGERYVRQALESSLDQTYPNVEIIVVDDGSTDRTPQILDEFGARITVIKQPNRGAALARNAALQKARGEFFAFLDADDLWFRNKLALQVRYLTHHNIDLAASRWRVVTNDEEAREALRTARATLDETVEIDQSTSGWLYSDLLLDCVVHTTTVVMRRQLVEKIGMFDASLRRGQDYDYWLRASRVTQIHTLAAELSCYRLHEANSTWQPQPLNYGAMVIERALSQWGRAGPDGRVANLSAVQRRLSDLWSSFGHQHATYGSLQTALSAAGHSIAAWPFRVKPWRLLAVCAAAPLRRR
jgi:glycosyltransferase involved in cell wall biosynthesis